MNARNICQLSLVLTICALLGLSAPQLAVGQTPAYTITDLGTLGGTRSTALSINNSGQVTGYSETASRAHHAFLYTAGSMLDLGTLGGMNSHGYRISDSGLVVGQAQNASRLYRPFIAIIGSPMFDLSSLSTLLTGQYSAATGVNSTGQVVGYFLTAGGHEVSHNRAFLYSGSSITDLGTFGGQQSIVTDINDSGQMIGYYSPSRHAIYVNYRAFLRSGSTTVTLGTLGGSTTTTTDLNNSGQVVGHAKMANGVPHAFLYTGGVLRDLGTLAGGRASFAYGINASGQVVGASDTAARTVRAFLYSGGVMRDLNNLIAAGSGWVLTEARSINNSGQIAGTGVRNGQRRAFLLTPTGSATASAKSVRPGRKRQTQHRVRRAR